MEAFLKDLALFLSNGGAPSTIRRLAHDADPDDNVFSSPSQTEEAGSTFTSYIFWTVNAIWMSVLLVLILWCWKCGGAERLTQCIQARQNSDVEYALSRQRQREREEESKKVTPEERTKHLKESFQRNKVEMIVEETDFVQELNSVSEEEEENRDEAATDENEHGGVAEEEDVSMSLDAMEAGTNGFLRLRPSGRVVPNCCAVCLGCYEVGESLVWSSNPKCKHAFHTECLTDWLVKMQDGTPCPCCRQEFTDLADQPKKEKKISWDPERSMDVSVIRLR